MVDTGFFVAFINEDDTHHPDAQRIFSECLGGRDPKLVTSDYILDEAVTLIRKRTKSYELSVKVIKMITESRWLSLEIIEEDIVMKAKDMYIEYDDKDLSFTDIVSAACVLEKGFDGIISFDDDFDGIGINRMC